MSSYDELTITVRGIADFSQVSESFSALQTQISTINHETAAYGKTLDSVTVDMRDNTGEVEKAVRGASAFWSPLRTLSRDVYGLGYAFRRLGTILGINNDAMKILEGTLLAVGSALRIVAIIEYFPTLLQRVGSMSLFSAWGLQTMNAELAETVVLEAAASGGTLVPGMLAGAGTAVSGLGALGVGLGGAGIMGFQHGGIVPYTGLFMLHRGETVTPTGGPNYSWIFMNNTFGAVSSNVDMNRMLDMMAVRMAIESRRRRAV